MTSAMAPSGLGASADALGAHGITFGKPQIDLDKLRDFKSGVVKKLTGGLAGMAKMRKVEVVTGTGTFVDPNHFDWIWGWACRITPPTWGGGPISVGAGHGA